MFVFDGLRLVDFSKAVVDGLDDVAAESEAAFAGGCLGGYEEEQVRIDRAVGIDSEDVRETGGDDGHRAEDEDVSVFRGVGLGDYLFEE